MYTIKHIYFTYTTLYNNNYSNKYIIKKYKNIDNNTNNTDNTKNKKINIIKTKPLLEYKSLINSNIDYDKYKLSKYVNNNTTCQTVSVSPPMLPSCIIL